MQVKVNDRGVEIFSGARVTDALRKYSRAEWTRVARTKESGRPHGHEIGLDGELNGGENLILESSRPRGVPLMKSVLSAGAGAAVRLSRPLSPLSRRLAACTIQTTGRVPRDGRLRRPSRLRQPGRLCRPSRAS